MGGGLIAVTQEESREGQQYSPFKEHESLEGQGRAPPLSQKEPRGTFQHMAQFRQQMETVCEFQH